MLYTSFTPGPVVHFLPDFQVESYRHRVSASHQSIAGETTILCSKRCLTPEGLDLLRRAGLPYAQNAEAFSDDGDYLDRLESHISAGRRIAAQHTYDGKLVPKGALWIDPEIVTFLNSKANLAELVPLGFAPRRDIIPKDHLLQASVRRTHPFVIKAVTTLSTGSGGAVVIVRKEDDLEDALSRFQSCAELVVEEFVKFTQSVCVNFATDGRSIEYLGSAEQIVEDNGHFLGNWFGEGAMVPSVVIDLGEEIMRNAVRRGYRGFGGFDIGITPDGRPLAFDLNFRLCASTIPLQFLPSIQRRSKAARCGKSSGFSSSKPLHQVLPVLEVPVAAGMALPLLTYQDPVDGGSAVRLLLLGEDRDQVDRLEASLGTGFLQA